MSASQPAGSAFREIRALFDGGAASGLTDEQLLERFNRRRRGAEGPAAESEAAFGAIVGRHGPMVLGVCRRALRDPSDVGDAFQATFLVLVRQAERVRVGAGGSLAPWLYGVSVRVARRARSVVDRRRLRERTNVEPPALDAAAGAGRADDRPEPDLRAAVDEEVEKLPGGYRAALVLCHLQGLTHEEAAARLGCPVGTVRSRLARGRDRLRDRLARRGFGPEAVAAPARVFVPDDLARSAALAAVSLNEGGGPSGLVPDAAVRLAEGVSRMLTLKRYAPLAAFLATLLGAAGLAASAAGPKGPIAPSPGPVPIPEAAAADEPAATSPGSMTFVEFPPVAVSTVPPNGSEDVDPALSEVKVTFSKNMKDGSWSWANMGQELFPEVTDKIHYEKDGRTCVLPVKLKPNKLYAIWLNSPKFGNFRDRAGASAVPTLLLFKTRK